MINKNIPICLCCDLNYLHYACVTIASIAYNSTSSINFYILHKDIAEGTQQLIKNWLNNNFVNCTLEFIDICNKLNQINMKQIRHFNELVFARYFIPEFLPNLNKIIYLDSDTIILKDISKLYSINLEKFTLGAVYEYWLNNKDYGIKIKNDLKYLDLSPKHKYFSSGVLLIDCKKWKKQKITSKLLELYSQYREKTQYPDQDPLNKLFENNYKQLNPIFNTTEQTLYYIQEHKSNKDFIDLKNNIIVRHFSGDTKPWNQVYLYTDINNKDCSDNFNDWWFFAKNTPFIEALENNFLEKQMIDFKQYEIPRIINNYTYTNDKSKLSFKFLGKLPLLTIKNGNNKITYRLFNLLPILKIKKGNNKITYRLFNLLPIVTFTKKEK